jgi:hypothetical protein
MKGMPSITAFLLPYSRFPSFHIFLTFFVNNDLVQFFVSSFEDCLWKGKGYIHSPLDSLPRNGVQFYVYRCKRSSKDYIVA